MQLTENMYGQKSVTPIHISGWSRSRTTMLLRVIRARPDSFTIVGEHNFFRRYSLIRKQFPDLTVDQTLADFISYCYLMFRHGFTQIERHEDVRKLAHYGTMTLEQKKELVERCRADRNHMAVFIQVINYFTRLDGKQLWAGKIQARYIAPLLTWDGSQKVVGIVRDPRAVLASQKRKYESNNVRFILPINALKLHMSLNAIAKSKKRHPGAMLVLRYEDYVEAPEARTLELCRYLGIDFHDEMLKPRKSNSSFDDSRTGIHKGSLERWKDVLTPFEILSIERFFRSHMEQLGFEL